MPVLQKTTGFLGRYKRIVPVTKFLHPVFNILFYILCIASALILTISLILLFINVEPEKMLLPPDMSAIKEGEVITEYSLNLGNGIEIISEASDITLGHIKLVCYAKLCMLFIAMLCIAPVFRLMSVVFKNVSQNNVLGEQNAAYINLSGVIIMAGSFIYTLLSNVFNYAQINKFISTTKVNFAFDVEWFGIVLGLFIIIIGTIYGYACAVAAGNQPQTQATDITLSEEK